MEFITNVIISIIIFVVIGKIIMKKKYTHSIKYTKLEAIKCWFKIFNYKHTPPLEDKATIAGRIGEDFLTDYISNHPKFSECEVFERKRIYNKDLNRKNEIDMIVVSDKKIYVIECKNWKGNVSIKGDTWIYTTTVNGEKVTRKYGPESDNNKMNPIDSIKMKAELLYNELKKINISINMNDIIYKVIFINKDMELTKNIDKQHIILYSELKSYMDHENTKNEKNIMNNIIVALLNIFTKDEEKLNKIDNYLNPKIGNNKREEMLQYLESLPTWDYIELSKGSNPTANSNIKIYQGDLKRYENIFIEEINFSDIMNIEVKKDDNPIKSLINVILGSYPLMLDVEFWYGERREFIANPNGYITFQEAGNPETKKIDILQIANIKIGS